MARKEKHNEHLSQPAASKRRSVGKTIPKGRVIVHMMNGEFLSKRWVVGHLPFVGYIGLLLVVTIGWGYYTETVIQSEVQLKNTVNELDAEYFTLSSEYIVKKGRSRLKDKLVGTGLTESRVSPQKIKVKKYVFD